MLCITRTAVRTVGIWLALATMAVASAPARVVAAEPAAVASRAHCAGIDMLQELRAKEPATFAEIDVAAKATANASAVLWKIERAGRPASYLLGTIHMTDPRVTVFSRQLEEALAATDTLALEVADVSADATNAAIARASRLVLFTDGRTLDDLLSDDEYAKVKETMAGIGLPGETAQMFRPWVVSMILSVSSCERQKVKSGLPVLDMKLATHARERGLKVVGLETIESQLGAMAGIPDDQQLAMLRASLKFANRSNDTMETLLQLYLTRNMGAAWPFHIALAKKAGIARTSFDSFQRRIVLERNQHMRDMALPLLERGRVLVAVGALHLVDKNGLVALLRQEGYTLTPLE